MSTILDALKKSEQERKLNKLPTLTDIQAPQEPARWPLVLAMVFAVLEDDEAIVVNVVSYSQEAALRFAMVNGKMVREGDFIATGLKLEKINSDSVVLNLRGKQITRTP